MKKLILTVSCVLAAASLYAQGTVAFANNNSTLLRFTTDTSTDVKGGLKAADVANAGLGITRDGRFVVALFGGDLSATESSLALLTLGSSTIPSSINGTVNGRFNGGTITNSFIVGGTRGTFQIRVWETTYATWDDSVNAGSFRYQGVSPVFTMKCGDPVNNIGAKFFTDTSAAGAASSWNPLTPVYVALVPEPSTFALGALGLAALLFRRRK